MNQSLSGFHWRRWALAFFGLGLLIAGVGWYGVLAPMRNPAAIPIPGAVAGLPLTGHAFGSEAAAHIAHLHGKGFPLTGAAVGEYGNRQATVWVSSANIAWAAQRQIQAMTDAIETGDSPFQPTGVSEMDGCPVYAVTGMGQHHYYFRAGNRLIWLAVAEEKAGDALRAVLDYYAPNRTGSRC